MAVLNGYPYYFNYPLPGYQQQGYMQQQQQVQNGIIWVQGEAGAKSYLVAPNSTVQLWDSEKYVIYLKSADGSGMPSMKILDYTIRGDKEPHVQASPQPAPYVTREEFEKLKESLEQRLKGLTNESDLSTDEPARNR